MNIITPFIINILKNGGEQIPKLISNKKERKVILDTSNMILQRRMFLQLRYLLIQLLFFYICIQGFKCSIMYKIHFALNVIQINTF